VVVGGDGAVVVGGGDGAVVVGGGDGAVVVGGGDGAVVVGDVVELGPHATGALRPTPRGSKETMSKRSSSPAVSTLSSFRRSSIPDEPGPPGLMTREPIRCDGSAAGRRSRAILIIRPSGWL
jgi:hypothetical protein